MLIRYEIHCVDTSDHVYRTVCFVDGTAVACIYILDFHTLLDTRESLAESEGVYRDRGSAINFPEYRVLLDLMDEVINGPELAAGDHVFREHHPSESRRQIRRYALMPD